MLYSGPMYLLCFILIIMLNSSSVSSMTREQIKNSGKLMKKTCAAKNDLSEDQVKDVDKGKFIEEKNFMCYIACVYKMGQSIKGNTLNHDMMIKQVDMMFPPELKSPVKAAIKNCIPVAKKYKNVCEASYWSAKCVYEFDPPNFVFP